VFKKEATPGGKGENQREDSSTWVTALEIKRRICMRRIGSVEDGGTMCWGKDPVGESILPAVGRGGGKVT